MNEFECVFMACYQFKLLAYKAQGLLREPIALEPIYAGDSLLFYRILKDLNSFNAAASLLDNSKSF